MSLLKTVTLGVYARTGYEVHCDHCPQAARTGLTQRRARQHAFKSGYHLIPASDRPEGYWLCPACFKCWNPRLTIQEFLQERLCAVSR